MDFNSIVSCKDYVNIRKEKLKKYVTALPKKPTLVVCQVDSDPASNTYVKGKEKDCKELGLNFKHIIIDSSICNQDAFESLLTDINKDADVSGIIIQLPIPDMYNVERLQQCISPEKDVDGFRRDSFFKPCTPKGIIDWLKFNNYDLVGKDVTVVGRSKIVGKPLVNMLIDEGATVTCCNSRTKKLFNKTGQAELVITAIGKAKYFNDFYLGFNTLVVDVGINRDENGKLCGDVDRDKYKKMIEQGHCYITPVPNGVGLITRLALMENIIEAYRLQNGGEKC